MGDGRGMKKPNCNLKGFSGTSYGLELPVRFTYFPECNWVVYNVKTGKIYASELESWEAPDVCMRENEKLGFDCSPDIGAIDSTP